MAEEIVGLFGSEGIELELFDEDTQEKLKQADKKYQEALQKIKETETLAELNAKLKKEIEDAKRELEATQTGTTPRPAVKTLNQKIEAVLSEKGVKPELIKGQAEILGDVLTQFSEELFEKIGQQLSPIVNSTLDLNLQKSLTEVENSDKLGMLKIKSVRESVINQAQELTKSGTMITPGIIKNLASMEYIRAIETNPDFANLQKPLSAGNFVLTPAISTAQPTLNNDTVSAINAVIKQWKKN